jgi:hypothetical protein
MDGYPVANDMFENHFGSKLEEKNPLKIRARDRSVTILPYAW